MDQFALLSERDAAIGSRRDEQTLQRVLVDRPAELRPLYWRTARNHSEGSGAYGASLLDDGTIALLPDTTLLFDSYFGAFFEPHWRLNTRLQKLVLSVSVVGPCVVRLRRRAIGVNHLLGEMRTSGDGNGQTCPAGKYQAGDGQAETLRFEIADDSFNFREYGLLYFEVTATGPDVRFLEASWLAQAAPVPVALGIVFCTFNRESFIAAVLRTMVSDPVLLDRIDRVFVVNQGKPGLVSHPDIAPMAARLGDRLTIIEQGNFGGAGGFTRGMLATLDDPALTHCAFLDDDIRLEPDAILRLIAFLSLANEKVAVGGQMLDSVQPMRLYEGGAIIETFDWFPKGVQQDIDLTNQDGLDVLVRPQPVHFNGWWCFAVSLDIVRQVGLPLPCFIRGDDAEYGMRLYRKGIYTTVLPGAAVWHEPFYLKLGSWQLYYETRNLLVLAALHDRFTPLMALHRAGRSWLLHLLTFRYYSAALILHGITDFLAGPDILKRDPQTLHADVVALRTTYGPGMVGRKIVLDPTIVAAMPRWRVAFLFWFVFVLLRNALSPTANKAPTMVPAGNFSWVGLRHADHVVLDNWWEPQMSAYRRNRGMFWQLSRRTLPVLARLLLRGAGIARSWQAAAPELTSAGFWGRYLGCESVAARAGMMPAQPCPPSGVKAGPVR